MARKILLAFSVLLALGTGYLAMLRHDHPDLSGWNGRLLPAAENPGRAVTVRYYGVSTLVFSDGDDSVIVDGFLTRPGGLLRVTLGARIEPDEQAVRRILREDGVAKAHAVAVVHSHYDHSMDAPVVAAETGAVLLGSRSTANVGRGWGLPDDRIVVTKSGTPHAFGDFEVTLVRSRHVPLPFFAQHTIGREILSPLVPPKAALAYLEGGSYSILISHPLGTALVQGSAGWQDGALASYDVDTVFLGIAGLSAQDEGYRRSYLDEIVGASKADRVIPIHFDDFTLEMAEPGGNLPAMPRLVDDIPATLDMVYRDAEARGIEFAMLPLRHEVVIFDE